jgi:hypothetical protein
MPGAVSLARIGRAGWGVYCSAKFAVEGLGESLGHELAPLGIQVTAVEPGGFRTNFLDDSSLITAQATIEDYAGTAGATRQWAKQTNYAQAGDPVKAAKVIVDLAGQESLPERIQLGEDCFTAVASKLARTARDQARWREISISTGYRAWRTRQAVDTGWMRTAAGNPDGAALASAPRPPSRATRGPHRPSRFSQLRSTSDQGRLRSFDCPHSDAGGCGSPCAGRARGTKGRNWAAARRRPGSVTERAAASGGTRSLL